MLLIRFNRRNVCIAVYRSLLTLSEHNEPPLRLLTQDLDLEVQVIKRELDTHWYVTLTGACGS